MFALFAIRRCRCVRLSRAVGSATAEFSSSPSSQAAAGTGCGREGRGEERTVMTCDEGTASAWNVPQPRLGTWPNIEPGVPRPDVVPPPEPSVFVKERKMPIIGGVTDSDLIREYDRIKGTADLNDNANITSGL